MRKNTLSLGVLLALGLLSTPLLAAQSPGVPANLPAPLAVAQHAGMQIIKDFPAASGLTGWVLEQGGQYSIVYTTADKQTLLAGALIDGQGHNLTALYGSKYVPKPNYGALAPQLLSAAGVVTGELVHPKSTIYVLFDPNCIFCHLSWEALKPYEAAGLQVKWLPVAFLQPTSAGIASAILMAKDPAAAFEKNETGFVDATEVGGLAPQANVPGDVVAKIKANNALMQAFGSHGTPAIIYKDAKGQLQVKDGMPRLSELPGITGLPSQPEISPDLSRFQ